MVSVMRYIIGFSLGFVVGHFFGEWVIAHVHDWMFDLRLWWKRRRAARAAKKASKS